ncbi:hypothetical protein KAR91_71870 [Candidatus Pacearchaeota archaeon]|nr:hypothetical protein [Candidatus Pacearchaeota archaeon]
MVDKGVKTTSLDTIKKLLIALGLTQGREIADFRWSHKVENIQSETEPLTITIVGVLRNRADETGGASDRS